jgi:hypothetical protein
MHKRTCAVRCSGLSLALVLAATPAVATDLDFSGSFVHDDDIALVDFTVGVDSDATLFSSSWIQGDPPMGFDPALGVWRSDGSLVHFQDDGLNTGQTLSNGVWYDHGDWDAYFDVFLAAGAYTVTLTQHDNSPLGANLADGFYREGQGNFTDPWGPQDSFNGRWDNDDPREKNWEFHILTAPVQTVPEPSSGLVFVFGGAAIARLRRRRPWPRLTWSSVARGSWGD